MRKLKPAAALPAIPLLRPNPPRLSALGDALAEIEASGVYSNYGPVNRRLEDAVVQRMFAGQGGCVTVSNATLGLMLAVKQAVGWQPRGRYALMPAFTFAAAAHAALWCGLTPLFCDVNRDTWLPCAEAEAALLERHGADIAVVLPNATFGNCLDLARYARLSARYNVPVVVDAAASLGSEDLQGRAFGQGSAVPLVFSMHATKAFATAEAGLVYCADAGLLATLRAMGNFGFGQPRSATMPGLNAKLGEVSALLGLTKLAEMEQVTNHRHEMYQLYRRLLPGMVFQRLLGRRIAHPFVPVLVPPAMAGAVPAVVAALAARGIGAGRYFVPHLAEQPYFQQVGVAAPLPETEALGARIIALPMADSMTAEEVARVCDAFGRCCAPPAPRRTRPQPAPHSAPPLEATA